MPAAMAMALGCCIAHSHQVAARGADLDVVGCDADGLGDGLTAGQVEAREGSATLVGSNDVSRGKGGGNNRRDGKGQSGSHQPAEEPQLPTAGSERQGRSEEHTSEL